MNPDNCTITDQRFEIASDVRQSYCSDCGTSIQFHFWVEYYDGLTGKIPYEKFLGPARIDVIALDGYLLDSIWIDEPDELGKYHGTTSICSYGFEHYVARLRVYFLNDKYPWEWSPSHFLTRDVSFRLDSNEKVVHMIDKDIGIIVQ